MRMRSWHQLNRLDPASGDYKDSKKALMANDANYIAAIKKQVKTHCVSTNNDGLFLPPFALVPEAKRTPLKNRKPAIIGATLAVAAGTAMVLTHKTALAALVVSSKVIIGAVGMFCLPISVAVLITAIALIATYKMGQYHAKKELVNNERSKRKTFSSL